MKKGVRQFQTRASIMKLLSDDEVAKVSTAESAVRLLENDEYLDFERLDLGVQRAIEDVPYMGVVLPKKAIPISTWIKILANLDVSGTAESEKVV